MRVNMLMTAGLFGGTLVLALGLATPQVNGAPSNQPPMQPSPRPTLVPTAVPPTAVPTSVPRTRTEEEAPAAPQYGRVTGTVIDQRTGAPAPGVTVMVGGDMLVTDVSGNYDHWMQIGSYSVALSLNDAQGQAMQSAVVVDVLANGTTVQHLFFQSPAPAPQPTAVPESSPVVDTALAPAPQATMLPVLPASAGGDMPQHLPSTGAGDDLPAPWLWPAIALVFMGGLLSLQPVRLALLPLIGTQPAPAGEGKELLSALLTSRPRRSRRSRPTPKADAALLESLLSRDE